MYAHQVIEGLDATSKEIRGLLKKVANNPKFNKNIIKNKKFLDGLVTASLLIYNIERLKPKILNAQKFHLELQTNQNYCPVSKGKGDPLFLNPPSGEVRPPYKLTYFDWPVDFSDSKAPERRLPNSSELTPMSKKRAILCEEILRGILIVYIFNYFNDLNKWECSPMAEIILTGRGFCDLEEKEWKAMKIACEEFFPSTFIPNNIWEEYKSRNAHTKENVAGLPFGSFKKGWQEHYLKENIDEVKILASVLVLLSCKNITTEIIPAPDRLNKKRIRQGRQPLFSYHTLVIKPIGKRQESIPKHLWENRIHLQRGHFKTYTIEKPLFGRITGRFWWQPHVRGQNKDGIVLKDYEVRQ
jgi:hypothetical protein